ncbi:MAG: sulfate ABC transporter permease subunit CysT [Pirellulales bacterium]|nr:sulfate ABC transporter permease subunit CysT [Pirellulales bacterium]
MIHLQTARRWLRKRHSVLPGFGLTLGFAMLYLSLLVLIPLSSLFVKSASLSWADFWNTVSDPRVLASFRLTFGAALAAALVNAVFGLIVTWVLVRYSFFGKRLVDAMIDLPFAMPTAVSGITLTALFVKTRGLGKLLYDWFGLEVAYTPLGIMIALVFIGLPFVVRTLQPALEDLDLDIEESAASLGATRFQTFRLVIFPAILPALLTGFALSFARALGEYGSVVFIAGNQPGKTEIAPLLIMNKLEDFHYREAAAIAVILLLASFLILLFINIVQWWSRRYAI